MNVSQSRWFASCAVAALLVAGYSTSALAQARLAKSPLAKTKPAADARIIHATHPALVASVMRLQAGSAAWRQAVEELAATGRRALLVTPHQVRVADAPGEPAKPFDDGVLAEVQPIPGDNDTVDLVVVVINVELLEVLHARNGRMFELDADLDRILAHEVYGHAMPYLLAGHLSGRCADPVPGQHATDACAIQRENEVRMELGLGRRDDYGLNGLALARRHHHRD